MAARGPQNGQRGLPPERLRPNDDPWNAARSCQYNFKEALATSKEAVAEVKVFQEISKVLTYEVPLVRHTHRTAVPMLNAVRCMTAMWKCTKTGPRHSE